MSGIYNGFVQGQNYRAQAKADEANALLSQQAAASTRSETYANEDAQRRKSAAQMGSQTAAMAEAGIGLDSGTAIDLTEQSALNAELDALNIRYAGLSKARGYDQQANNYRASAILNRKNAKQAVIAGFIKTGEQAASAAGGMPAG